MDARERAYAGNPGPKVRSSGSPLRGPRDSKSAFTRVCDALCVAGCPTRGRAEKFPGLCSGMSEAKSEGVFSRISLRSCGLRALFAAPEDFARALEVRGRVDAERHAVDDGGID